MSTSWFLDFCFVCDRQTLGGAYCSQRCRLAELDISSAVSEPSSPTTIAPLDRPWNAHLPESGSGLNLGPPFDFASYRAFGSSSRRRVDASTVTDLSDKSNPPSFSAVFPSSRRTLTPSSSQTSLSSLQSVSASRSSLSGQVRSELQDYTGCFDQVRDWKRRLTAS
jgi:hypothetical protein